MGIGAAIAAIGSAIAEVGTAAAVGLGATEGSALAIGAGTALEGGVAGAALGAGGAAIQGKDIGQGALAGGLTGGITGGFGGALGSSLGIGSTAGFGLAGAAGGALGAEASGGNPLTGALTGAASGAIAGATAGSATPGTSGGGPGVGAAASQAPIGSDIYTPGAGTDTGASVLNAGASPNPVAASSSAPSSDIGANLSGESAVQGATNGVELAPLPPVPPSLDASGNPALSAGGELTYPSQGLASAANRADVVNAAGGIVPKESFLADPSAAIGQATGQTPAAGTLGYQVNPSLGVAPGGSGPGGSFTYGQGAAGATSGGGGPSPSAGNSLVNLAKSPSIGTLGSALGNNANLLLPAAVAGLDIAKGNQAPAGLGALEAQAASFANQGKQLQSYLATGTLPPGVQTSINQATAAAQAAIRSQYASRGMSGSSAEAQDLVNVQNTAVSQGATIAQSLLNTGVNESNLSASLYAQIMQQSISQDSALASALASLAASTATPTRVTLNTTSG